MHYSKVISILTKVIKEVNDNLSQNYDEWWKGKSLWVKISTMNAVKK
jgi:hypothetical protein